VEFLCLPGASLVMAAGDLSTAFGTTGWRDGEAQEAAALAFDQWIEGGRNLSQQKSGARGQPRA
jgi:hypothetical protein